MTLCRKFSVIFLLFLNFSMFSLLEGNITDREALLDLKRGANEESLGVLSSWNDSRHFCQWPGVICSTKHRQRVVGLDLQGQSLSGFLSPAIGNLSFLRVLNLASNSFRGHIPPEVGHLSKLQNLNVSYNSFQGSIPSTLFNCTNLVNLALEHNQLHGHIPIELGSLFKLVNLSLHVNNLTGTVPSSVGNLSSLQQLLLYNNQLEGELPSTIAQLSNLRGLGIAANKFHGTFPSSVYNLSSLQALSLAFNRFSGSLRPDIGLILPELQTLLLSTNNFSGSIPASLTNASSLTFIDLSTNSFSGDVPLSLGNLQDLTYINLEENMLGGTAGEDLNFITSLNNCSYLDLLSFESNTFQSDLPSSITNLSTQLTWLSFGFNYIQGKIPEGISKLSNLNVFSAEANFLTGSIPVSIGQISNLQILSLASNNLTGQLPSSIGNISGILSLFLNDNSLEGEIPSSIRNCSSLQIVGISVNRFGSTVSRELFGESTIYYINMSTNHLSGQLPPDIGMWTSLTTMDVSNNRFSGTIPNTLRHCLSLEELHMQKNGFSGSIPHLKDLKGLLHIDFSHNNLSGQIPSYMINMPTLQSLNLSFNGFDGLVPLGGIFLNTSAFDINGNTGLCGGIQKLHLVPCPATKPEKSKKHHALKYVLPGIFAVIAGCILLLSVLYCTRRKRKDVLSEPSSLFFFPKVSYQELFNATTGFSEDNFIGSGTFGTVYKGILGPNETTVAVKVLNLQQHGASKSFIAECDALGRVRHRNLVKVLTACSSLDFQGNEFKAIVYQFMPNGSLDTWLHPVSGQNRAHLYFLQRINIATDVASAMCYLHNDCETPVVHCDLKPSNILLDDNLTAHVSDFGLARILSTAADDKTISQLSSAGIKGTIGYTAPEYGMGASVSANGDMYSFGILLLEIFTGKRPTCEQCQGNNLHNFIKMALPMQVLEIVDKSLLSNEDTLEVDPEKQTEYLISVLQVALLCSEENPKNRMAMDEATSKLIKIREKIFEAGLRH